MTHLILCREYPPAPYPAGGIGTYARHIARLLAEAGETVHMIGQRWEGAPESIEKFCDGRLIVHRISVDEPIATTPEEAGEQRTILRQLAASTCPTQMFSWQAARYIEALLETETIDVIEAQEWEAPLYYLLARRAAGLGPRQQPPCIVHLHSPTQMIFEHNEWDQTLTDFLPLARFEEYTIRSADALLCPSHYLAAQVSELFELGPGRIDVIPYAMGVETPILPRSPEVWSRDAICYVGRLELRKGVVEWVDAAVNVARTHATVSFDFFGGDTYLGGGAGRSVLEFLKSRIPASLRDRFRFHGTRSRAELLEALANVAIAVVPSRWENFPFTCIEAMSTGLPVLASPNGGMAEMIVDGESGWIATDGSPAGLEAALLRALATSPANREAMGARAAETIRRICHNDAVVAKHIAQRKRIVEAGVTRSNRVAGVQDIPITLSVTSKGMGILVTCFESPENLSACLKCIASQTLSTPVVVVAAQKFKTLIQTEGAPVIFMSDNSTQGLRLRALQASNPELRCVATIDQDVRLDPTYAAACESIFANQPHVGVISPWILRDGKQPDLDPGPSPMSLAAVAGTALPPYSAVRTELLQTDSTPTWDLLRTGGWAAFTYPGPLLSLAPSSGRSAHPRPKRRYSGMALIQSQSPQFALQWFLSAPLSEKARWLGRVALKPQRLTNWLGWQIRSRIGAARSGKLN